MVQVLTLNLRQRFELFELGLASLDLLSADELWTEAAKAGDPVAGDIGRRMIRLIERVGPGSSAAGKLLLATRYELNAYWPHLREDWRRIREPEILAFDRWLGAYDGLGNAGVAVASILAENLADEAKLIGSQIAELERGGGSGGDLLVSRRVWVGAFVVCLLVSAALPIVVAAVTGVGLAAATVSAAVQLANVGASIAGSALLSAQPSPPSPPPIISPDGKQYWDGTKWVPLPTAAATEPV